MVHCFSCHQVVYTFLSLLSLSKILIIEIQGLPLKIRIFQMEFTSNLNFCLLTQVPENYTGKTKECVLQDHLSILT